MDNVAEENKEEAKIDADASAGDEDSCCTVLSDIPNEIEFKFGNDMIFRDNPIINNYFD